MCVGTALTVLSTLAGVAGTVIQASATASAAKAQAQQDRNNAIIAQRNAEDARKRGVAAEQDVQLRTRARIGMQKNVLSERNIALSSGSALDILGDTAMFGKLDALTTRHNFEREAIAAETQKYNFLANADQADQAAKYASISGGISAFSTALGGFGQLYQKKQETGSWAF